MAVVLGPVIKSGIVEDWNDGIMEFERDRAQPRSLPGNRGGDEATTSAAATRG